MKKLLAFIAAALICVSCTGCNGNNSGVRDITAAERSELINYSGLVSATGEISCAYQDSDGYIIIDFVAEGKDQYRTWHAQFKPERSTPKAAEYYFESHNGDVATFYGKFDTQRSTRSASNYLIVTEIMLNGKKITANKFFNDPPTEAPPAEPLTEAPTEPPTEPPTEAPTEAPTEISTKENAGTKIYEDDKFTFYFVKVEPSFGDLNTYFTIKNKTKSTYKIHCDYLTLNNSTYSNIYMSEYMQENTQSLVRAQIADDFVDTKMTVISAGGQFKLDNEDNDEDTITIKIPDTKI
ncbi:hypothetical protein ACTQ3M_05240 [Oscillospiraceae bacterium LCP25S3_E10]